MNLDFITAELFFAQAAVSSSGNSGVQTQHTILSFLRTALPRIRKKSEQHYVMDY